MPSGGGKRAAIAALLASIGVVISIGACAAEQATSPLRATSAGDVAGDAAVDPSGRPIDITALAGRLQSADHVLLGEVHDNPAHHRLRAALLRALLADGRPTWVVFEQIDRQHNAAVAAAPRDTEALVSAGQLNQKGWGWPLHRPLFDAALAGGATVVGGNLSRAEASRVVRGGVAQVPVDLQRWLAAPSIRGAAPPTPWTAAQDAELRHQVDVGHCGALPPDMIVPMALAQRARDAALAQAMLQAPPGVRVVLIAGNGHVRRDTGVPHYLATQIPAEDLAAPGGRIVSLGVLERASDGSTAMDGPYDEVWFTARAERPDPCAGFRVPAPVSASAAH